MNPLTVIINKPVDFCSDTAVPSPKHVLDVLKQERYSQVVGEQTLSSLVSLEPLSEQHEGLVVLTNNKTMLTPTTPVVSVYEITLTQALSRGAAAVLSRGMPEGDAGWIPGVIIRKEQHLGKRVVLTIESTELTDTQIQALFQRIGYEIKQLKRIAFGKFRLGVLAVGQIKIIS